MKALTQLADFANQSLQNIAIAPINANGPIGLYNGDCSRILAYAVFYQYTGNRKWKDHLDELFASVSTRLAETDNVGFEHGISGFGWLIEWLAQHKISELNTDVVLEDFDDLLYKLVLYGEDDTLGFENATLSKIIYFNKRINAVNRGTSRYKTISHQECLVILTDALHEKIEANQNQIKLNGLTSTDLIALANSVIFISKFVSSKINFAIVEDCLYRSVRQCNSILNDIIHFGQLPFVSGDILQGLIRLAYALKFAGAKTACQSWSQNGHQYLETLIEHMMLDRMPEDCNQKAFSFTLPIITRQFVDTGDEKYLLYLQKFVQMIKPDEKIELNIDEHLSLFLSVLTCIKPTLKDWDEAVFLS